MLYKSLCRRTINPLFYIAFAACFMVVNLVTTLFILGNPMANNNLEPPLIVYSMSSPLYLNIIVAEIVLSSYIVIDMSLDMYSTKRRFSFSLSQILNFSICLLFLGSSWTIFVYAIPKQDYYILRSLNQIRIFSVP